VVEKLRELKPLPKIHYSWGISGDLLDDPNSRLLYEFAKITHSISVNGADERDARVSNAVYICARVNKTKPEIPASIAINLSPFHYKFDKNLGPTDRGQSFYEEINFLKTHLMLIKSAVDKANIKYFSNVKVTALLFDSEMFIRNEKDEKWNLAICEALEIVNTAAGQIFPEARIEWFGQGIEAAWGREGWDETPYSVHCKMFKSMSCILYTLPEIERMRETFRKTSKLADQLGITDVTPWIALGSGLKRTFDGQQWDSDWDYDLIYSWSFGAELNVKWYADNPKWLAQYDRAKIIVLFPSPFNKLTPNWSKHFIAYVRGANGTRKLDDLK
jgi:hypothetical protein